MAYRTRRREPFVPLTTYGNSGKYRDVERAPWRRALDAVAVGEVPPPSLTRAEQRNVDSFRALVSIRSRGCWPVAIAADTRGRVQWRTHRGRVVPAWRFAWVVRHGPVPELHRLELRCGSPTCANPRHVALVNADGVEVFRPWR